MPRVNHMVVRRSPFPSRGIAFGLLTNLVSLRKQERIDHFFMSLVETRRALHDARLALQRTRMLTASPRLSALEDGDTAHVLLNRGGCDSVAFDGAVAADSNRGRRSRCCFFGPRRRNLVLLFPFISRFSAWGESCNKK